ncbi:AMP-binding protein [Sporichthya polymorpha]|uniref:AMP-binding protein n=1 Tax=Sporichthya polymorpha TaxID=35751 RepID=UPI00036DD7C4|nr:AMP-binding protein [Sporichthya polymorpha]
MSVHRPPTQSELVVQALRRFPDRVAFRQGGKSLSYAGLADALARWLTVLREHGIGPGGRVGLLSLNRPEVWLAQVAPGLLDASYTALHPAGSFSDHLFICDDAELTVLIVDPAFADRAAELAAKSATLTHVLTLGPSDLGSDLLVLADRAAPSVLEPSADPESTTWLLYTGGTTGLPKGVHLSQRALAAQALNLATGWDLPRERRYLSVAPISHASGLPILPTLLAGGTTVLMTKWDPEEWLRTVADERVTMSFLVPTMIYSLLDTEGVEAADRSSLEAIVYGASPMSPARLREGIARLGGVFTQMWGQTESTGTGTTLWRSQHDVSDTPEAAERLTSCGQATPGVTIAVLDPDGQPVEPGEIGELCLRGPSVMTGYHNQPELTEQAFAHGWLHTGDVGRVDSAGFAYIVDRLKDLIITGGYNVYPTELEKVISAHPAVAQCAVIGVPDTKWGEAVKAVVVVRSGMAVGPETLIDLVRQEKGSVQAPKSVDFVDAIPVTGVGKPDKKTLRARYWADHDRAVN